ncbi:hypothetical protein OB920_01270 [Halobacteria archaeon HArc-gm2]|nr:hypothetical protein [Halobacteria archaeon HArc-gm2]
MRRIPLPDWASSDSRGVSDLVAFVLTFSIIITAVGVVSIGGLGSLEDYRDGARAESAEVAMTGFDSSMEDIRVDGVPQRSHQLQLNGDQLERHSSVIEITISGTPRGPPPLSITVDVGAFVRQTGRDTEIAYESGAVYRSQDRGQTVVSKPPFRCGADTANIGLVSVRGDVNVSSDSLALRARENGSMSAYPKLTDGENGSASDVTIDVSRTHNPDAWQQLFDREMDEWTGGGGTYTCDDVDRVYVHNTSVELSAVN